MNNTPVIKINNVLIPVLAVLCGLGLVYVCALWDNPTSHVVGLFVAILLSVAIVVNTEAALWILVILRSSAGPIMEATMVFPGAWSINISGILNWLTIFGVVYCLITKRINLFRLPASKPYLLFIIICIISVFFAPDRTTVLRYCVRFASYFMVYVLAAAVLKSKKQIRNLIHIIFLSAIVPLLLGFYQMFMGTGYLQTGGFNRIYSTFGHPVPYGFYLMIILPFALVLFFWDSKFKPTKYMWGAICLALGVSLIQTFTRGAIIGLVIAAIVIGLRYKRVLILLPLILLVAVILFPDILHRFSDVSGPVGEEASSVAWRINLWRKAFPMIRSNLLLGNGLGSFLSHTSVKILGAPAGAHNVYLRLAMETGLIGLAAYLWVIFALGKEAVKTYFSVSDTYVKSLNLAFISVLAAYVVASVGDNMLEYVPVQWYLWLFAAIPGVGRKLEYGG